VYCEKPLGITYDESRAAVAYCAERKVPSSSLYYAEQWKITNRRGAAARSRIGRVRQVHFSMTTETVVPDENGVLPWRVRADVSGAG
jgi:predicted dehydrogenase